MRKLVMLFFIIVVQMGFAAEQEESNIKGMSFKMQRFNTEDFNSYNEKLGMPKVNNTFMDVNMGTIFSRNKKNNIVIEMEGTLISSDTGTNEGYLSKLWGAAATISVGYEVYRVAGIGITPHVGVGFGKIQWALLNRKFENIDDILSEKSTDNGNIGTGIILERSDKKIFVGIEGDIQPIKDNKFSIIVDLGYDISFNSGKWKINGIEASGGPKLDSSGPFFRLGCGF